MSCWQAVIIKIDAEFVIMNRNIGVKIIIYTLLIIIVGLLALYSAASGNSRVTVKVFYNQFSFAVIGLFVMLVLSRLDYRKFYDVAYILYIINMLLLVWVLVAGRHALGASRWIQIGGVGFQPSEFSKISLILMLSRYFSNRSIRLNFGMLDKLQKVVVHLIWPFILTAAMMLLIFKQPDLGTALLMFGIFIAIVFASGLAYKYILGFLIICVSFLPFAWGMLKTYQKNRLLVFLNPNIDPLGAGYTITQSKIAIGSGQIFGKGWLAGTQNQLNFLPERHTDFIFSVIGEEWGLIGTLILVFLYFQLIMCGLRVAEQIKDNFGRLTAVGIVSILALQVIINIGMVMGMFPIVGLTLPLISYGRSSFFAFIIMIGILLNLSHKRSMF